MNLMKDEYYMANAILASMLSPDPNTQVGACIVSPDGSILGVGHNTYPKNNDGNTNGYPTGRDGKWIDTKYPYICHAELMAILNTNRTDLRGCTMYVTLFPCNECAKLIVSFGISKIIYKDDKYQDRETTIAAKRLLTNEAVICEQFITAKHNIPIIFNESLEVNDTIHDIKKCTNEKPNQSKLAKVNVNHIIINLVNIIELNKQIKFDVFVEGNATHIYNDQFDGILTISGIPSMYSSPNIFILNTINDMLETLFDNIGNNQPDTNKLFDLLEPNLVVSLNATKYHDKYIKRKEPMIFKVFKFNDKFHNKVQIKCKEVKINTTETFLNKDGFIDEDTIGNFIQTYISLDFERNPGAYEIYKE